MIARNSGCGNKLGIRRKPFADQVNEPIKQPTPSPPSALPARPHANANRHILKSNVYKFVVDLRSTDGLVRFSLLVAFQVSNASRCHDRSGLSMRARFTMQ